VVSAKKTPSTAATAVSQPTEVRWFVKQLDHFDEAGKPVLVID
jgi:hypothetical protein